MRMVPDPAGRRKATSASSAKVILHASSASHEVSILRDISGNGLVHVGCLERLDADEKLAENTPASVHSNAIVSDDFPASTTFDNMRRPSTSMRTFRSTLSLRPARDIRDRFAPTEYSVEAGLEPRPLEAREHLLVATQSRCQPPALLASALSVQVTAQETISDDVRHP